MKAFAASRSFFPANPYLCHMQFFRPLLYLILASAFLFSCKGGEDYVEAPDGIIPSDSMAAILVDFHLAEGALLDMQQRNKPTAQAGVAYFQWIFEKHHINRQRMSDAMEFYSSHPRLYTKIYDQVLAELSRIQGESMKQKPAQDMPGFIQNQ
jgi:hypothetical protein